MQSKTSLVSHTASAGLLLREQANLKAYNGFHVLGLLLQAPSPRRIMQLISLQHKHTHESPMTINATTSIDIAVAFCKLQAFSMHFVTVSCQSLRHFSGAVYIWL